MSELAVRKGGHPGHKTMLHTSMTSLNQRKPIGGAGNHRVVGSVYGLAARGVANPANAQNIFVLAHLMLAQ